jgi:1,4-dihydroxy-2-naphthoyl-CoA hydrolase
MAHETKMFSTERSVRFQDVDAAGVVFFARIFEFFHDNYAEFLASHGCPLEAMLQEGSVLAPLTQAEAEFSGPLHHGERMQLKLVGVELRNRSVTLHHEICVGGQVRARGQTRHVFVDPKSWAKTDIPSTYRRAFETLQSLS